MCQNFDSKDPRTKAVTEPNFITQKIFDAVIIIISQAGVGSCVGFCTTPKTYTLHGKLTFPSNALESSNFSKKMKIIFLIKTRLSALKSCRVALKFSAFCMCRYFPTYPKNGVDASQVPKKKKFPIFIKIFFGNNFFNCQIFCRALLPLSSCSRSDLILKHPIFGTTKYLLFFFNKRLKILTRDWSTNRNSISFF